MMRRAAAAVGLVSHAASVCWQTDGARHTP